MMILRPETRLLEKNGRVWFTTYPPHQEQARVIVDTPMKGQLVLQKNIQNEVDAFACFIDENMLKHVVKHTNKRVRRDLRNKRQKSR